LYATWTVKHKPKVLSEVIGNKEAIQKLLEWLKSWDNGVPKKRAAFLYGSPGIGKTVTVETVANDFKMEFVEKNASDYRTEDAINHFAGLASRYGSLFGHKRIILLDELDGLTGNSDRGGVKAITEVVKAAETPIVLISDSAYDQRFSNLRFYCLLIEFKKPSVSDVAGRLKQISKLEGIQIEEDALKFIAQRSEGDVRSAINDLQALAQGREKLTYDDVSWLGYRDRQDNIFNVLRLIMYGKSCSSAKKAIDMADVDIDMLFEWIYENVPSHFTDPHDLAEAMDALSLADVYRGRIRASQDWGFTRYVIDNMTAGIAMARRRSTVSGWIPFKFPGRIQALSRSKSDRALRLSIGRKIKQKSHLSAVKASREVIPYLRIIFKNDENMAAGISKWLDLDREMLDYIVGNDDKAEAIAKKMA
jgi:replication factor C large subunit